MKREKIVFYVLDRKECFLHQKNDVLKKSKKSKFSKGVCPMIFVKKFELVSFVFFQADEARKDRCMVFWIRKLFRSEKWSLKERKGMKIF